jgi:hypothetical protein
MVSPLMVAIAAASSGIRYYGLQDLTNVNSGGGAFTGAVRGGQINLPTTTGATSRYHTANSVQHMGSGRTGGFDWSKTVILSTRFRFSTSPLEPGHVIYILLGCPDTSGTTISGLYPDGSDGVGVRINDNMTIDLIAQAGALATFVSVSGGTIAANTAYDITVVSINGFVRLYLNGVLVATTSSGPTTTIGLGAIRMSAELTAATAALRIAYSGGFTIYNGI